MALPHGLNLLLDAVLLRNPDAKENSTSGNASTQSHGTPSAQQQEQQEPPQEHSESESMIDYHTIDHCHEVVVKQEPPSPDDWQREARALEISKQHYQHQHQQLLEATRQQHQHLVQDEHLSATTQPQQNLVPEPVHALQPIVPSQLRQSAPGQPYDDDDAVDSASVGSENSKADIHPSGPLQHCQSGKCDVKACQRYLFQKGKHYLEQLRIRHPELEKDRDRFLKTSSKRNRRRNTYPSKARRLLEKVQSGDVNPATLSVEPQCIRSAFAKLVKESNADIFGKPDGNSTIVVSPTLAAISATLNLPLRNGIGANTTIAPPRIPEIAPRPPAMPPIQCQPPASS